MTFAMNLFMFKINLNIFTLKVFGLFFIKPIDQLQLY